MGTKSYLAVEWDEEKDRKIKPILNALAKENDIKLLRITESEYFKARARTSKLNKVI
jgi:hypothetical protein